MLRTYADRDWKSLLDVCQRALGPACESLEGRFGMALDWRPSLGRHLRPLTRPGERRRLVVADRRGEVLGFVHYEVDPRTRSGRIGLSAVHPDWQGRGIGSRLYRHVLGLMRDEGVRYATAEAGGDRSYAPARRAYEKVGFVAVPTVHFVRGLAPPDRGTAPARRRKR